MTAAVLLTILVGVIVCLAEIALGPKSTPPLIRCEPKTTARRGMAGHVGGYVLNIR
jgi:hypothetical protein